MTPLEFAQRLAKSDDRKDVVLGVAMLTRSLTDEDPNDPLKMPWPMDSATIKRAEKYLGVELTPSERGQVFEIAPDISDAMLNR